MPLKGERLDRPTYRILHSLRGGHVGEVYLADHDVFNAKVVQKTYSPLGREDSIAKREPQLLFRMKHDHIVRIYEAQPDPEYPDAITFVMAYCEGGSILDALLKDFRFSLQHAVTLTMQTLDALTYVHTTFNVVHRDIKPPNVYTNADRQHAFLGDFGSAAEMDASGMAGSIQGTILYTPPEAGPAGGRVGVPGDVYQTGFTLFEMINGRFPYEDLESGFDHMQRRLDRGLRSLPDSAFRFAPHVPGSLRRIIRRSIAREPARRYQTASALSRALWDCRFIDWTHVAGSGLDGRWEGTWPAHLPIERRRIYAVESRILRNGRRRLIALQQLPSASSPSRFGVEDATLAVDDADGATRFFEAIATEAAHRVEAR